MDIRSPLCYTPVDIWIFFIWKLLINKCKNCVMGPVRWFTRWGHLSPSLTTHIVDERPIPISCSLTATCVMTWEHVCVHTHSQSKSINGEGKKLSLLLIWYLLFSCYILLFLYLTSLNFPTLLKWRGVGFYFWCVLGFDLQVFYWVFLHHFL